MKLEPKDIQRFESKFTKGNPEECWEWQGKLNRKRGRFSVGAVTRYAYRFAYWIYRGEIPDGLSVCHTCDNPSCVNPDHLWLGTQVDNMRDMALKSRGRNAQTKLTPKQVKDIREKVSQGFKQKDIAAVYSVCPENISNIVNYKSWKYI